MFHFCIVDSEHDWREGTEQYKFIEKFLASADRHKQPWLNFAAHRVLGGYSNSWHVMYYSLIIVLFVSMQNICVNSETSHFSGIVNGTIHAAAGGGGSHLSAFADLDTKWSIYKDYDFGFVKLTASIHTSLLFEYKKSRDGKVYDSFTITWMC
ncbi:hypothetical protein MRB53_027550 [Persea americana]|uniref:Uncharacterized protein n=1 Tax=Persea americana TaxID=3435 RepID=A0ACC2LMG6_PERAE|nr:hypothetical protein MRB53_027550 [Persea americana]